MVTQSNQGAVRVFSIDTALNAESADSLRDAVLNLPRGGRPQLVIDLSSTPLIDSAGCESLLDVHDAVAEVGGAAHLAAASPLCRDIIDATGLSDRFALFDGVKEAVASYAR